MCPSFVYFPDEDKENEIPNTQDDNTYSMASSKDTVHILRLSAVLHILTHYWRCSIEGVDITTVSSEICAVTVRRAHVLYNMIMQQKSIFIQVKK